jgi:DNA repair protein RadC
MIIKIAEDKKEVLKPADIYQILSDYLKSEDKVDRDKEHFWVFHLDCRNKIKLLELVSLGTLNSSLVHPREVFTRAVGQRSTQIIIAHNHPSGVAEPSEDDISLTKRLMRAGNLLGIELIDHIIVTTGSFISLKEKSLI